MHHHQNKISTHMNGKHLINKNSSLNLISGIGIIFSFWIRKMLMKLTIICRISICNIKFIGTCSQFFLRSLNKYTSSLHISRKILHTKKKGIKGIKSITSTKSKNNNISSSFLNNGKYITESITIANIFNDFCILLQMQLKLNFLVNLLMIIFLQRIMTLSL